jgi:hypothetical protein
MKSAANHLAVAPYAHRIGGEKSFACGRGKLRLGIVVNNHAPARLY